MRAVVLRQADEVAVETVEDARIEGPTDVVLRVTSTAICGSDLALLGSDDIDELARLLRGEHYPAGATIFRMGEAPTRIGIVRRGAVELSRDLNGRRVMLQILRTGDAVGDVGVFLRITAPYDGVPRKTPSSSRSTQSASIVSSNNDRGSPGVG